MRKKPKQIPSKPDEQHPAVIALRASHAQEGEPEHRRNPLQNEDGTWRPDPAQLTRAAGVFQRDAVHYPTLSGALKMLAVIEDDTLGCPTCLRSGLLSAFVGPFAGLPGAGRPVWDRHYVPPIWANKAGRFPPPNTSPDEFLRTPMLHLTVLVSEHGGRTPDDLDTTPTFAHTCAGVPGVTKHDAPFLAGLGISSPGRAGTEGLADVPQEAKTAAAGNAALRIALLLAPRLSALDDETWGVFRALLGPEAWARSGPYWAPLIGHTPTAASFSGYRSSQASIDAVAEWLLGSGLRDDRTPPPPAVLTDAERLAALEARMSALLES